MAKPNVAHQGFLLAAYYSFHCKKPSKGSRCDLADTLVKDRHRDLLTQLSEHALKTAKAALTDSGVLIHISGPTNKISPEAIQGIESWKQTTGSNALDDERACAQYLEHGLKGGNSSVQKTVVATARPSFPRPGKSESKPKSKGKKTEEVSEYDDDEEESEGSDEEEELEEEGEEQPKGKKRAAPTGPKRSRPPAKKVKVAKPAPEVKSKKGKAVDKGKTDDDAEGESEKKKQKKRQGEGGGGGGRRRTGPAGPGIGSLKRDDLISKVRELEAVITEFQQNERESDESQSEEEEETGTASKAKLPDKKGKGQSVAVEKGGQDDDDDELSELEDSQLEEEEEEKQDDHPPPRRSSPAPIPALPLAATEGAASASTLARPNRAVSLDALPLLPPPSTSGPIASTSTNGGPSNVELSHLRHELEQATVTERANFERKQALQEDLDLGSHAHRDLHVDESENARRSQRQSGNGKEAPVGGGQVHHTESRQLERGEVEPEDGDATLVEQLGGVEESGKFSLKALLNSEFTSDVKQELFAQSGTKRMSQATPGPPSSLYRHQDSPRVDEKMAEQLASAKEEIAKLNSIRSELARERNDATEEKADLRRMLGNAEKRLQKMSETLKTASLTGQGQLENVKLQNEEIQKKLRADQQTITALTQDLSDSETEKEALQRKLELRDSEFAALSSEAAQIRTTLDETKSLLNRVGAEKVNLDEREKQSLVAITRLEEELRIAHANARQVEEERQNEVELITKETRAKSEELQLVKSSLTSLQLDIVNLAVSCNLRVDETRTPKSIVNDLKSRHLSAVQQLAQKDASERQSNELARRLVQVLSPKSELPPTSSVPDLLKLLTVQVSDVLQQAHEVKKISNEAGVVEAIADLAIAGGGIEVPTFFAELPRAIKGIKAALVEKNTAIVHLEAKVRAAEGNLQEANLSHKTLEASLDQIQGELSTASRQLDHD